MNNTVPAVDNATTRYLEQDLEWKALVMANRLISQKAGPDLDTLYNWVLRLLHTDIHLQRMDIVPLEKALSSLARAKIDKAFNVRTSSLH